MEHLTRNTNNDRIINTIKNIKAENSNIISKELKELADRIVTVFSGILSSLISGIMIAIIKNEKNIQCENIWIILLFLVLLLIIWFLCVKFAIPYFSKFLYKEKINLAPQKEKDLVKTFNCEIMQKVAEVNEIVDVIQNTNISECKMLNFVMALYKLQEIVDFLYINFCKEDNAIRKSSEDGAADLLRYSFNSYTISAVVKTVIHIKEVMTVILEEDDIIRNLGGYELIVSDIKTINIKIESIEKYNSKLYKRGEILVTKLQD